MVEIAEKVKMIDKVEYVYMSWLVRRRWLRKWKGLRRLRH
jgi:hypothetical protein